MSDKCETCNEPTKYIYAFGDGKHGPSYTFHCKNETCPEGKILRESIKHERALIERTKEANLSNDSDVEKLKIYRFIEGITFYSLAKETGIPVTTISDYFNYRKIICIDDYNKIIKVLNITRKL